jgi:hypothetical protein
VKPKHSHSRAAAHANLRLVLKLVSAVTAFKQAHADERRLLAMKLDDPRNEIAERSWRKSCAVLAVKMSKMDDVVTEFELSARLQKEAHS